MNLKYQKAETYFGLTIVERLWLHLYLIELRARLTKLESMLRRVNLYMWGSSLHCLRTGPCFDVGQMKKLTPLAVKILFDESVISKWTIRLDWKDQDKSEDVKCVCQRKF